MAGVAFELVGTQHVEIKSFDPAVIY
jgi:hypothetical protein